MMYIEGHWENVDTLEGIVKIVREHYNSELADRMDWLIDEMIDSFNDEIEELKDQIYSYDDDYDDY